MPDFEIKQAGVKTFLECFNALKPVTKGLNSSLNRNNLMSLPLPYRNLIFQATRDYLLMGIFPERFLTTKVRAIMKKGKFTEIKNRRFLSVGLVEQQLLGKVFSSALLDFCEKQNILDDVQYGFREKHGCDAIANLLYRIFETPEKMLRSSSL